MNKCFIYGFRAAGVSDYFYVGSTKRSPAVRLRQHISSAKCGRTVNKHLESKILKVGTNLVVFDILEEVASDRRSSCEYSWIAKLRAQGHKLTNIQLSDEEARQRCRIESARQKYLNSIFSATHVLWQLDKLEEPVTTSIPSYYPLAIKLNDLAVLHLRTLADTYKNEWFQRLGLDPECELSGIIQTRIKALPLLC